MDLWIYIIIVVGTNLISIATILQYSDMHYVAIHHDILYHMVILPICWTCDIIEMRKCLRY